LCDARHAALARALVEAKAAEARPSRSVPAASDMVIAFSIDVLHICVSWALAHSTLAGSKHHATHFLAVGWLLAETKAPMTRGVPRKPGLTHAVGQSVASEEISPNPTKCAIVRGPDTAALGVH
jgi:hypothetical protein